ncbi:hypothetical protein VNO77_13416 [Canavalia gladiata]|uniref:Uncharacterized protein n=1 Tax=Canavalia gladiata TaxID=3824 RepID=A0AAN9QNB5_CANGL
MPKMDECKRRTQIPAFGNWDFTNELPITRYFECARHAGLVRYSCSSNETPNSHLNKPLPLHNQEKRNRERHVIVNGRKKGKSGKLYDVREQQGRNPIRVNKLLQQNDTVPPTPKSVDEDLYKIPPQLLHKTTKRKRMLGFISKCLVPASCVS